MNILAVIVYFLSVYIIQTTFLSGIAISGNKPDLLLVSILCFSMIKGKEYGSIAAIIVGVCLDILCGQNFGPYTISMFITSIICGMIFEKTFHYSMPLSIPTVFVLSLCFGLMYYISAYLPSGELRIIYIFLNIILPTALYNTLFALPVYAIVNRVSYEYDRKY